jgi:hypothetical protein
MPGGTWISFTDAPRVSATGWLAIPFRPGDGPSADPAVSQGIVVVDLSVPQAKPWVIPNVSAATWNDDDELAMVADSGVVIADPRTRTLTPFAIQDQAVSTYLGGPSAAPVWTTTPGTRFLARRSSGGTTEWGYVDDAGRFTATTDLPPISQRTGIERRVGAGAHQLMELCTGGGTPTEAGCTLAETDSTGSPVTTWVTNPEIAYLDDSAWADDGHDTWLLFEAKSADGSPRVSVEQATPTGRTEVGQVGVPESGTARIIGIGPDEQPTNGEVVAIGTSNGFVSAFVDSAGGVAGQDGTAWFAGWAGRQADYDPD